MADVFYTKDAIDLLHGKKIYFIGDSNIRALYKDVLCLLVHNRLLTEKQLKDKAEKHFLGDDLLRGSVLTKGRSYKEDRRYRKHNLHVEFHFVTKCLNEDIVMMMNDFRHKRIAAPDILVMNSTLWDVNRWGYNGVELFKDNMMELVRLLKTSLPPSTLVIWVTAPPLSVEIRGGFMIKQIEFAKFTMRFHVMEANMFAQQVFSQSGFNVLDFHFHLRWQVHWRRPDGLHWSSKTMRHLTNLLLTHISLALTVPLPGNYHSATLNRHKAMVRDRPDFTADVAAELPEVPPSLLTAAASASAGAPRCRPSRPPHGRSIPEPQGCHSGNPAEPSSGRSSNSSSSSGPHEDPLQRIAGQRPPRYWGGSGASGAPSLPRPSSFRPACDAPPRVPWAPRPPLLHDPAPGIPPPLPPGAGPSYDFSEDHVAYSEDGPFYDQTFEQPQQIQSLWGPVRRRHGDRRERPY